MTWSPKASYHDVLAVEQDPGDVGYVNGALFEPLSEEYFENKEKSTALPIPDIASTSSPAITCAASATAPTRWAQSHRVMKRTTGLPELVSSGDYARAESLREELLAAKIHIKRHLVYAQAALHVWSNTPAEDRTEAFYRWFRLTPSATLGRIRRARNTLFRVQQTLFADPMDLNTIACFGLVASRKGFANFTSADVIAHIARFAAPRVSAAFFDACEQSALAFYARFRGRTREESSFSVWDAEKYHNSFVRALCFAGYLDEAVDRLSYASSKGIPIAQFTWVVLLENLVGLGRDDLIATVRKLRSTTTRGNPAADRKLTRDSPSATSLAQMMSGWIESGNTQDIENLRNEMVGSGLSPDLWVVAQMKYYQSIDQHAVVLKQFLDYYMCTGIPKDRILPYIRTDSSSYNRATDNVHPFLPLIKPPARYQRLRRWPSTHTLTMVLQSLVSFVEDVQELSQLYRACLTYWDHYRPTSLPERLPALPKERIWTGIQFQYPPAMKPDAVHFHVFVVAFARLSGMDAAMQVLVDMHERGIRPDVHNWTVIAGGYAALDDMHNAERILKRMEQRLEEGATPAASVASADSTRTLLGPVSQPEGWIPAPTLATYTTILRGLIDRGSYAEARQFEKRMMAAGYVPGSDERTESVLELLRQREATPRIPWQQRVRSQPSSGRNG